MLCILLIIIESLDWIFQKKSWGICFVYPFGSFHDILFMLSFNSTHNKSRWPRLLGLFEDFFWDIEIKITCCMYKRINKIVKERFVLFAYETWKQLVELWYDDDCQKRVNVCVGWKMSHHFRLHKTSIVSSSKSHKAKKFS